MNPPASTASRTAWIMVLLLFPVALLNYLDRQMLATMQKSMVSDIPTITNEEAWGSVLAAFKWTYAFLSPIGGFIADRFSRRHVICFSLFAWSIVTWVTGHVTTMDQLIWARAAMGISEAFYIPAALALIADFHIGGSRSTAVGVHQTGIYIGQMLGGLAGFVADAPGYGWQWMFTTCGIVGVIYALPLMATLKNPPRSGQEAPKVSPVAAASELFTNRNFLLLVAYFTLPAIAGWVIRDWGPKILRDQFGLTQGRAGMIAVFTVQIASLFGVLCGGLLADRLVRRSTGAASLPVPSGWSFSCRRCSDRSRRVRPMAIVALASSGSVGVLRLQQHADPFPDHPAGGPGDRLRNHEPGQHDLRRPRRQGLRRPAGRGVAIDVIFGAFAAVALLSVAIVLLIRPRAPEMERKT